MMSVMFYSYMEVNIDIYPNYFKPVSFVNIIDCKYNSVLIWKFMKDV